MAKKQTKAEKKALRLKQRQDEIQQQRDAAAKKRNTKKMINLGIVGAIVLIIVAVGFTQYESSTGPHELDEFAKCITQAGAGMYGTDWCPHCQEQKRMFGRAFQHVVFINCDQNPTACQNQQVTGYPTWIFQDGERLSGVQSLYSLAEQTGCQVEQ